jgi:PhnB protein
MTSRLNPYLAFNGDAREAMEFYKSVFGGELTLTTFGQFGMQSEHADKIMHALLETDSGFTLMASDTMPDMAFNRGDTMTVSLSGDDSDDLRGYWNKLSASGAVTMPLEKQAWGDEFGACTDQFGTPWMVNISQPQA